MSRTVKKAKIAYTQFDADSPTFNLQEGAAHIVPQESLELFEELFKKLSGSHWFCEVGEA
jgi:hypothetical protein